MLYCILGLKDFIQEIELWRSKIEKDSFFHGQTDYHHHSHQTCAKNFQITIDCASKIS